MATGHSRRGAAVALGLVLLASCRSGANDVGGTLLLSEVPAGYEPGPAGSDEVMSLDTAAKASVAEAEGKENLLVDIGYTGGHSRVWVDGPAHISAVVYGFSSAESAQRLVTYEVEQAKTFAGSYEFKVSSVPGAHGYVISGSRRDGRTSLFCHSVWFARDRYAFNVSDCSERPGSPVRVLQLAEQQEARAALGDEDPSSQPRSSTLTRSVRPFINSVNVRAPSSRGTDETQPRSHRRESSRASENSLSR